MPRPRRTRKLPLVAASSYTAALLAGVAEGEAAVLALVLDRADPGSPARAAAQAAERAEALIDGAFSREPPPRAIACAAGCGACCAAKVLLVAPEVLRLADHLREALSPEALDALLARVRETDALVRGLSRAERMASGVSCPLLVDGSCSVHPVRPLACRGWTSFDAGACGRYASHGAAAAELTPPLYAPQYELANAVLAGLGKACRDSGRDGAPLELVAALRIGLERPRASERWLAGLPVFATARDEEWAESHGATRQE